MGNGFNYSCYNIGSHTSDMLKKIIKWAWSPIEHHEWGVAVFRTVAAIVGAWLLIILLFSLNSCSYTLVPDNISVGAGRAIRAEETFVDTEMEWRFE